MQAGAVHDASMRKVIHATLNSDPTATFETVLRAWRFRRSEILEPTEESLLADLFRHERSALTLRRSQGTQKAWWRIW